MRIEEDVLFIGKKAVIADVHLGLVRHYDGELIEKALSVAEKVEMLIVAGDLKHLGKRGQHERFIREVGEITELILVRGNHDIGLECEKGIRIGKYGIFHGHAVPDDEILNAKFLIFGHAHPAYFIRDSAGGYRERVFLTGDVEGKKIVVLPAFNELCASTAVNLDRPAGFMFRKYDYRDWYAVMLDGTLLKI
uniref:Calcineurin-like phosphoesterase domain-containing protein n=1 Tax=Archaeoglobus fulgidus TaxID=2234 RepID=A0A7C3M9R5_ARCFL